MPDLVLINADVFTSQCASLHSDNPIGSGFFSGLQQSHECQRKLACQFALAMPFSKLKDEDAEMPDADAESRGEGSGAEASDDDMESLDLPDSCCHMCEQEFGQEDKAEPASHSCKL